MKKNTTIRDISVQAGVSIATVSRFLNGSYTNMSEETRHKLERIVRELDYHPNNLARGLKSQNSHMIGCVVADMENPFSALLIKGIQSVCRPHGYKLLILDAENDPQIEKEAYQTMLDTPVEGIICNTTGFAIREIEAASERAPIVLADRLFPRIRDENDPAQEQIARINRGLFQMLRVISNMSDAARYSGELCGMASSSS